MDGCELPILKSSNYSRPLRYSRSFFGRYPPLLEAKGASLLRCSGGHSQTALGLITGPHRQVEPRMRFGSLRIYGLRLVVHIQ